MEHQPTEYVTLVDDEDRAIGRAKKLRAHRQGGMLHRAFSITVFDSRGRVLLQRRAATKYHFPNLWSNACCGHPRPEETVEEAAHRRLREELGFDTPLESMLSFLYQAHDPGTGLSEYEFDHVLVGTHDGDPKPDPAEVSEWRWMEAGQLLREMAVHAERYTPWLPIVMNKLMDLQRFPFLAGKKTGNPVPHRGIISPIGQPPLTDHSH